MAYQAAIRPGISSALSVDKAVQHEEQVPKSQSTRDSPFPVARSPTSRPSYSTVPCMLPGCWFRVPMSQASCFCGFSSNVPIPLDPPISLPSLQKNSQAQPSIWPCLSLWLCLHQSLDEVSLMTPWVVTNPIIGDGVFRLCIPCCQEK